MKRILTAGFLVLGLSFASLINTTDQVNNKNRAFGGNPAVAAYEKTQKAEAGITGLTLFGESTSKLDTAKMDTGLLMFGDLYGSGAIPVANGWAKFGLTIDSAMNDYSVAKSNNDTEKIKTLAYNAKTKLYGNYSLDLNKYVRGLYAGAELGLNSALIYTKQTANKASQDNNDNKSLAELSNSTPWYASLAFGAIYDFNREITLTAGQTFSAARNWDLSGQTALNKSKPNTQYNEEMQPETSVGAIYKLSNDISIGGTATQVWNKIYTETRSDDGTYSENDITKWGYRAFTLNGEYKVGSFAKMLNDVTIQGYYGWAKDVGRQWNDTFKDTDGTNDTYMGINASSKINDRTSVLVGAARTIKLGLSPKDLTDETKLYVNGSYLF